MSLRLTFIAHGATAATRTAAFPHDESLEPASCKKARTLAARLGRVDAAWTSPARRAVETANALALTAKLEPQLADLDVGCWAARLLDEVAKENASDLSLWMEDPASTPHGGEPITALLSRVARWLDEIAQCDGRVVAVTHAAVIRAAAIIVLDADPKSFWRIDIGPLSASRFNVQGCRWTLRSLNAEIG